MEASPANRRLAAILAADIAGYSRLMAEDEEATLRMLAAYRAEISDLVAAHGGRIFGTGGDSVIVEFASAVNSVRAAVAIQRALERHNADVPKGRRMEFRIGINVGDIVQQNGDILGDGVNIAARLEGIAEPGGVCVSQRVQEDAAGKVDVQFEDIGEQALKNIARPVRVYRVRSDRAKATALRHAVHGIQGLPDKPSIAVLPFQNMSGDSEQDYFADGVVEDIITALSRFKSFAVIARNSSFVYKGRAVDVRQVAKELGVRYVLEGSVRRAGQRLRITAQLIEATSGAHLWADRFDGAVEDIFDVQDKITESVVVVIEPQIRHAEIERSRRKHPENLDAYDLYLRALSKIYTTRPEDNAEVYEQMMQAIALEPDYAPFLTNAVWALEFRTNMGWPMLTDDDRAACIDLARRALANAHGDPTVLAECGSALVSIGRDYDRGLQIISNALEANPNNQFVLICAAVNKLHCGDLEESLAHSRRAILMSPGDPMAQWPMTAIAHAHMALGNYEDARKAAELSLAVNPNFDPTYWILIASNVQLGKMDEARRWLAKFRDLAPGVTIADIKAGQPDKYPDRMAAILEGLRLAGLEE
jgi:adenylate cyclase